MMNGLTRFASFVESGKAYGAFNVFNVESLRGVVEAVIAADTRAYVQTSVSTVQWYGVKRLSALVEAMIPGEHRQRFLLHLDHCLDAEIITACLQAGWDSVMIDASRFALEENIRRTREVVLEAHRHGAVAEGEIGSVGEDEDGFEGGGDQETEDWTPAEIERFARETEVDLLAVGVGTKHGYYRGSPCEVDVALLKETSTRCPGVPLVLHGGSGIPLDQVAASVRAGVRKINVSTEIKEAYLEAGRVHASCSDPFAIIDGVDRMTEEVKSVVDRKVRAFERMSPGEPPLGMKGES